MNYARLLKNASLMGALKELEELLKTGQETFLDFEENQLEQPLAANKWSRKEIVGHLVDSALNNIQRFTRAQIPSHLEQGVLVVAGYAQNDWVSLAKYNDRLSADLIELWRGLNEHILSILEQPSAVSLAVQIQIGDGEPSSLEDVFISYVGHVKHHLQQLTP